MEFKGTKGNWVQNGVNGVHTENGRCVALTYQTLGDIDSRQLDALLISKPPEMLGMLIHVKDYLGSDQRSLVEQLIKEATTL